jgi:hypothetical protein
MLPLAGPRVPLGVGMRVAAIVHGGVAMKRCWMWLLTAALATTVAVPVVSTAQADDKNENETPTSLDKIPAPARSSLLREAGGSPIINVMQEMENGRTVYEAHVKKGNDLLGIEVDETGKVLKRENENNEKK